MSKLPLLLCSLSLVSILSSCATLTNTAEERIDIITTTPAQVVVLQDTFQQVNKKKNTCISIYQIQ